MEVEETFLGSQGYSSCMDPADGFPDGFPYFQAVIYYIFMMQYMYIIMSNNL